MVSAGFVEVDLSCTFDLVELCTLYLLASGCSVRCTCLVAGWKLRLVATLTYDYCGSFLYAILGSLSEVRMRFPGSCSRFCMSSTNCFVLNGAALGFSGSCRLPAAGWTDAGFNA